jgi:hypothetical protein
MPGAPVTGGSRTAHAEEIHQSDQAPLPAGPVVHKSKWRRFADRLRAAGHATKLWGSTFGTVVIGIYQLIYFWHRAYSEVMPTGAKAWVLGFVMIGIYVVAKIPNLIGQEPGDAAGHVREVLLIVVNFTIAVLFLAHAYYVSPHAPNAVGISIVLIICFLSVMIAQLVLSIVLARRTWTDAGPNTGN